MTHRETPRDRAFTCKIMKICSKRIQIPKRILNRSKSEKFRNIWVAEPHMTGCKAGINLELSKNRRQRFCDSLRHREILETQILRFCDSLSFGSHLVIFGQRPAEFWNHGFSTFATRRVSWKWSIPKSMTRWVFWAKSRDTIIGQWLGRGWSWMGRGPNTYPLGHGHHGHWFFLIIQKKNIV